MADVADLIGGYQARTQTVTLLADASLRERLDAARRQLKQAELGSSTLSDRTVDDLRGEVESLTAEAMDGSVSFTFQGIGRFEFDQLKRKFPPTRDQWDLYRQRAGSNPLLGAPDFDPVNLAPALIARCCIEPRLTEDEAGRLWDRLTDGDASLLYRAALAVNMEASDRPF